MIDTSEKDFESKVEQQLLDHGYEYRHPSQYNSALCLDTEALRFFIERTQLAEWKKLERQRGGDTQEAFFGRVAREIDTRGTLDVLRKGIIDLGCKFKLAYFRPESTLNQTHRDLYNANAATVTRQVRYSLRNNNSLDLLLSLNGLPVITVELKNTLQGQSVEDAVAQYRHDRDPQEPLFAFGRCLAHFAVDPDLAFMTTHLRGSETTFLPFNRGKDNGAGNPENPTGFKTDYLWQEVLEWESLLDILNHFMQQVDLEDERGKPTGERKMIFPRYHQLAAVRNLVEDARSSGSGRNYLVQHSAGSGKSNTIAWLAHRLASLQDKADERVFNTILVITDRRVLDRQLQQTVRSFEQVRGTVTVIPNTRRAKHLTEALGRGDDIIVTTLQTFPFVTQKIGALKDKRFAVVIDEAHSSQSGETNRSMKEVLASSTLDEAEAEDSGAFVDDEDSINQAAEKLLKSRGRSSNISFFAFTATPKQKTLELFGSRQPDGSYKPFSLYSMRQAIEEGFILDVLKNYTTYTVYFSLVKKIADDPHYEKSRATYLLRSHADLHAHAISSKTSIMVEHFCNHVWNRIPDQHGIGQAKAMVVTRSRLHAVKYKQAFDKFLSENYPNLRESALVAFSGTVIDPDTQLQYTEAEMNGFPESRTAEMFNQSQYRFLIVADKFQTGFDQPLLHTMYVDKRLGGVNAVQTLSRLNRTFPSKDNTLALDFTNRAEDIQKAFQDYYVSTELVRATDPNKLYDLKRQLEKLAYPVFRQEDIDAFSKVYFSPRGKQESLHRTLDVVVSRYGEALNEDERESFRKLAGDYVRLHAFLSQLLTFTDAELEKFYQFLRYLLRKLPVPRAELPVEITDNINMDSYRIQQTSSGEIKLLDADGSLKPISELGTGHTQKTHAPLSKIVEYINEHYGTKFTAEDKVRYFSEDMERRLEDRPGIRQAFNRQLNPSAENRKLRFNQDFDDVLEDMIHTNFDIYRKITNDDDLRALFRNLMFERCEEVFSQNKSAKPPVRGERGLEKPGDETKSKGDFIELDSKFLEGTVRPAPPSLYVNLWVEDARQQTLHQPAILTAGDLYAFLFAIEPFSREEKGALSEQFPEPRKLRETPETEVDIELLCPFLAEADEIGYLRRKVTYRAGIGFSPQRFTLKPETRGRFYLTARLLIKGETIYREVLALEVVQPATRARKEKTAKLSAP